MNILLIGATGMVGSRILAEASSRGHKVSAAARAPEKIAAMDQVTALGLDKIDDAIHHAHSAHMKVPGYRPAVRYLTALNIVNENEAEARKYLSRLRKLEPDFTVDLMKKPEYPLHTLQHLGFVENLDFLFDGLAIFTVGLVFVLEFYLCVVAIVRI